MNQRTRERLAVVRALTRHGVVLRAHLLEAGLSPSEIDLLLRYGRLCRLQRGVYAEPGTPVPGHSLALAAVLSAGPGAVASGHTAAAAWGFALIHRPTFEEVTVSADVPWRRDRAELRWRRDDLSPLDVVRIDGLPVTSRARTLVDLLCRAERLTAVAACDDALHRGLVAASAVEGSIARARLGGDRAVVEQRWRDADPLAASPLETAVRLPLMDAPLPVPELQYPVRNLTGRLAAYLDLAYPAYLLGVEADGRGPHDQPSAIYRDNRRAHELASLGWQLLRFTWADAVHHPERMVQEVSAALAARRRVMLGAG